MNLQQLWERIRGAFVEAGVSIADTQTTTTRVIAASQLFSRVYDALRQINLAARYIGEDGYVYTDWEKYLAPMDVYYGDDGSLFLLCTRAGKILRIPVTVNGDAVALGEPVEIVLNGRAVQSSFRVMRQDGVLRWYAIAASSVLNRVNEIDSNALFDSFIEYATRSGEYPILSFYHMPETIRFGVADFLARDGNLYIAAGTFDDNEVARAAADGLERSQSEWGTSIGYYSTADPSMLTLAEGVQIPVYSQGINSEISIVLEREAAAHFTAIGAREVNRSMQKEVYDRLVTLLGKDRADALAAQSDETNRAIETQGLIHRADATPTNDDGTQAANADAAAQTNAPTATNAQTREIVLDDEAINLLAGAMAQSEMFAALVSQMGQMQTMLGEIVPQLNANTGALETARQTLEQRIAALERTDEEKRREWQADLPAPQTVIVTHRPRDTRGTTDGQSSNASAQQVASATLANMRTRQPATK